MATNYYGSDCSSESEISSIYSEEEDGEIEDECHQHAETHESDDSYPRSESHELVGPYSSEPLADADWLSEYNEEISKIEKRNETLQERFDGVTPNSAWCRCGHCKKDLLQKPQECNCCHEIEGCLESLKSSEVLEELEVPPICVTLHPGFEPVCLNRWSLRSSCAKYRTIDGYKYRQTGSEEELLRATAYREFTQLVHGYQGGGSKRIPLPACAYHSIRKQFPSTDFCGYEDNE
ncbi:uncharacterized protein LOC116302457 [Actinia tenebrosa]|uniref:Uncharacterized protein LOC116302457 n=1 Tax=Actinia tenebrosa TaxID=6105 RepID=A0A6P8IMK1_ACTTE|nr:uncharacterized protein LOC116302457 [Actinia tenebrosa]